MKNRRPKGWGLFHVAGPHDPLALIVARLDIRHLARPLAAAELRALWPHLEQAAAKRRMTPCIVSRQPHRHASKIVWVPAWLATRAIPERFGIAGLVPQDARLAIRDALHDPERRHRILQAGRP